RHGRKWITRQILLKDLLSVRPVRVSLIKVILSGIMIIPLMSNRKFSQDKVNEVSHMLGIGVIELFIHRALRRQGPRITMIKVASNKDKRWIRHCRARIGRGVQRQVSNRREVG